MILDVIQGAASLAPDRLQWILTTSALIAPCAVLWLLDYLLRRPVR